MRIGMSELKLPEELIEIVRHYAEREDGAKMETAKVLSEFWQEYGRAIEHEGKNRKWYIENLCAQVGLSPSSGYNRLRVGDNIIQRGFAKEHSNITFGHWLALLRNAKKSEEGLVDCGEINKRLQWFYSEFDKYGSPPSVRDIGNHYKKNGDRPEWELYWKAIVRNAKKLQPLTLTDGGEISALYNICQDILEIDKEDK